MDTKLRIAHLIAGLNLGGANTMLVKLLSLTDRQRFEPAVIVLMDEGLLGNAIMDLGIPLWQVGMAQGKPTPAALQRMARLLRQFNPALAQGWMYHGNLAASTGRWIGAIQCPVLWNIRHTPYDLQREKRLTRWLIRWGASASRQPAWILYNSLVSAQKHEALGYRPDRRVIIPNGFDVDRFQPNPQARQDLRGQLALDDRVPVIGMAARFHPMKDHLTFLRAAKLVHSQHPEAHFLLVGPNVDKNNLQLQEAIQSSGLEKQVHLLGERQDMPAIYSALDIASLSSAWGEGFPNVIGEAMACGIPCAVTDIGDAGLVVGDCGFSVPAREPQSLAAAWCKLLEMGPDGRRELGRRARQRVIDLYALPAIVRQYETLYERTLEAQ